MYGRFFRASGFNQTSLSIALVIAGGAALLSACGGGSSDLDVTASQVIPAETELRVGAALAASNDLLEISAGQPQIISLLSNDAVASASGNELQLLGKPVNGTATLLEDGRLEYVWEGSDEGGSDVINYRIVSAEGESTTARVFLAIACSNCDLAPAPLDANEPVLGAAQAALVAVSDSVTVLDGEIVSLVPMRNDSVSDATAVQLSVYTSPVEGQIVDQGNGLIVYAAPLSFEGSDTFTYILKDGAGSQSVASIDLTIDCPTCAYAGVRLAWPANPADQQVAGYRIYFGADENAHTASRVKEIWVTDKGFNADAPSLTFDLKRHLKLSGREGGCFTISAFRGSEESERSSTACFGLG